MSKGAEKDNPTLEAIRNLELAVAGATGGEISSIEIMPHFNMKTGRRCAPTLEISVEDGIIHYRGNAGRRSIWKWDAPEERIPFTHELRRACAEMGQVSGRRINKDRVVLYERHTTPESPDFAPGWRVWVGTYKGIRLHCGFIATSEPEAEA